MANEVIVTRTSQSGLVIETFSMSRERFNELINGKFVPADLHVSADMEEGPSNGEWETMRPTGRLRARYTVTSELSELGW